MNIIKYFIRDIERYLTKKPLAHSRTFYLNNEFGYRNKVKKLMLEYGFNIDKATKISKDIYCLALDISEWEVIIK